MTSREGVVEHITYLRLNEPSLASAMREEETKTETRPLEIVNLDKASIVL